MHLKEVGNFSHTITKSCKILRRGPSWIIVTIIIKQQIAKPTIEENKLPQ